MSSAKAHTWNQNAYWHALLARLLNDQDQPPPPHQLHAALAAPPGVDDSHRPSSSHNMLPSLPTPPSSHTTPPPPPPPPPTPPQPPRRTRRRRDTPCDHGRRRSQCVDCYELGRGGGSVCVHRRRRATCRDCRVENAAAAAQTGPLRRWRIRGPLTFVAPPPPPPFAITKTRGRRVTDPPRGLADMLTPAPSERGPGQKQKTGSKEATRCPERRTGAAWFSVEWITSWPTPYSQPQAVHRPHQPVLQTTTPSLPPTPGPSASPQPQAPPPPPPPRRRRRDTPCDHGRRRSQCVDCYELGRGGGSVCIHRRRRALCRDCRSGNAAAGDGGARDKVTAAGRLRAWRIRGPRTYVAPPPPPPMMGRGRKVIDPAYGFGKMATPGLKAVRGRGQVEGVEAGERRDCGAWFSVEWMCGERG
ncbi:hypothetical protein DFJ73DRAFT_786603 [Zopfochytrium polystomum]|nr:hypothetical protein DFJ73DRAFT_786603 [Zopfochytrium polystomum]